MDKTPCVSIIGTIMYAIVYTRLGITHTMGARGVDT